MLGVSGLAQESRVQLEELYQEVILDHSRSPRHKGKPTIGCQICQDGKNPLCGDEITVFCRVNQEQKVSNPDWLLSLQFSGKGCSISQASASMMCELIQNKSLRECERIVEMAEQTYTGQRVQATEEDLENDLDALFGVSKFPVRIKCAALPWKTLEMILDEHFDGQGHFLGNPNGCFLEAPCARDNKKLKVVLDD